MPVKVPKIYIILDSEGNVPVKSKIERFNDDFFGEKFYEELGDELDEELGDELDEELGDELDEGSENKLAVEREERFGKGFENEKKVGQASTNDNNEGDNCEFDCDRDNSFSNASFESQKQVNFEDDDKDDNALEAAEKRKKKKEEEENQKEHWHDLFEVLHREGLIFVGREMTMKYANKVVSLMVYLDREDKPNRTPTMFINSPGGFVFAGLAIYDTMDLIRYGNKVQTIVIGIAASMASVVLIGGGLRVAFTHAKVMIHQPSMKAFENESSEIALEARVLMDLRHSITEIYERKTARPYWSINADLECDKFMSATQARDYGIVDGVAPRKIDDDNDVFDETFSF